MKSTNTTFQTLKITQNQTLITAKQQKTTKQVQLMNNPQQTYKTMEMIYNQQSGKRGNIKKTTRRKKENDPEKQSDTINKNDRYTKTKQLQITKIIKKTTSNKKGKYNYIETNATITKPKIIHHQQPTI